MNYVYIRVSTDKQDFIGQLYSVQEYAKMHNFTIDEIVEEKVSGKVPREKRDLGKLVNKMKDGDLLITPELSRLGRSAVDTMLTLSELKKRNVQVHLLKENLISGTTNYDFMTLIYAGLADMERQRISERTKEALRAKIAQGVEIGHKKGYKCTNVKLTPHSNEIINFLNDGKSICFIANHYGVKWITARNFIRDRLHYDLEKIESVKSFRDNLQNKEKENNM